MLLRAAVSLAFLLAYLCVYDWSTHNPGVDLSSRSGRIANHMCCGVALVAAALAMLGLLTISGT